MRLLLGLMWLLHWLPLPVLGRIGAGVGKLLFVVMRSRRRITLINLALCLPELRIISAMTSLADISRATLAACLSAVFCGGHQKRAYVG